MRKATFAKVVHSVHDLTLIQQILAGPRLSSRLTMDQHFEASFPMKANQTFLAAKVLISHHYGRSSAYHARQDQSVLILKWVVSQETASSVPLVKSVKKEDQSIPALQLVKVDSFPQLDLLTACYVQMDTTRRTQMI